MVKFVAVKRALGRKYAQEEMTLRHLDRFLAQHFPRDGELSVPILEAWLSKGCAVTAVGRCSLLKRVRQFCLYRRRLDDSAFVPDRRLHRTLWPLRVWRRPPRIPTREDIRALLKAARRLEHGPHVEERRRVFFTAFLVIYAAGLRRSEAERLRVGDVDLAADTLLVRETKFFKTRIVPLAPSVMVHVQLLIDSASDHEHSTGPNAPLFRVGGSGVTANTMGRVFDKLQRKLGAKPPRGRGGVRLHDLRHAFAVHRIARWYADGVDVQSRLPALSTYMGHKSIVSTQLYMTVTPELLDHASRRFHRACAPRRRCP